MADRVEELERQAAALVLFGVDPGRLLREVQALRQAMPTLLAGHDKRFNCSRAAAVSTFVAEDGTVMCLTCKRPLSHTSTVDGER